MTKSFTSVLSTALVASALAIAVGAYAQDRPNTPAPQGSQTDHQGMMQGGGTPGQGGMGMMNMMGQMDPAEMKRMMENCNKMMEGMQSPSSGPTPEKKG